MSVPKDSGEVWAAEIWNRSWRVREMIHHRYLRYLTSSTGDKVEGRESVPLKWSCHACNFLSNAQPSGRWIIESREWGFPGWERQSCEVEKESEGAQHALESIAWMADSAVQLGHRGTWSRMGVTGWRNRTGGDGGLKVMMMEPRLEKSEWVWCEKLQSGLEAESAEMWWGLWRLKYNGDDSSPSIQV